LSAGCDGRLGSQRAFRARTNDLDADGEVVWFWHPDADAELRGYDPRNDGGKKARSPDRGQESPVPGPVPGESTKDTVKTIAQGRPDVQAKPVVTAASFFYCWRAMGAVGTRPSLRPLSIRRARE